VAVLAEQGGNVIAGHTGMLAHHSYLRMVCNQG
jgi:hypothetical protein